MINLNSSGTFFWIFLHDMLPERAFKNESSSSILSLFPLFNSNCYLFLGVLVSSTDKDSCYCIRDLSSNSAYTNMVFFPRLSCILLVILLLINLLLFLRLYIESRSFFYITLFFFGGGGGGVLNFSRRLLQMITRVRSLIYQKINLSIAWLSLVEVFINFKCVCYLYDLLYECITT